MTRLHIFLFLAIATVLSAGVDAAPTRGLPRGRYVSHDGVYTITVLDADESNGRVKITYANKKVVPGFVSPITADGTFAYISGRGNLTPFDLHFRATKRDNKIAAQDRWVGVMYANPTVQMLLTGVRSVARSNGQFESKSLGTQIFIYKGL